jgi:transcriptional regulator with XRE-family HTH domain
LQLSCKHENMYAMKKEELSHIGKNIRAIRLRKHFSQTELAAKLGMRPGPLNCIENGRNLPSARVIYNLSRILEVPADAFLACADHPSDSMKVCEEPVPYMAKGKKSAWEGPVAEAARTEAEIRDLSDDISTMANQVADAFLELETLSGAAKTTELRFDISFDRAEEDLARLSMKARGMLGVSEAVIFDYLELLENAGLRIVFCNLPEKTESISCHDVKNSNAFIFIRDREMTPERQLFHLAYELGRLYMHAPDHYHNLARPRAGRDRRGKLFTHHRASRRFAGLFLMPEAAVRATVRQLGIQPGEWTLELLYRLKHRFGVSAQTMLYRLRELKLIVPALEKEFDAEIKAFYKESGNKEPDSSRRVLTPNGRIWDLFLSARIRRADPADLKRIKGVLERYGARKV